LIDVRDLDREGLPPLLIALACESPIAIACLRDVTFLPLLLRSVPFLNSRIVCSIFLAMSLSLFAMMDDDSLYSTSMKKTVESIFPLSSYGLSRVAHESAFADLADLDEESRKKALTKTEATLKELVRVCRGSDVPVSMLPQIIDLYTSCAREVVFERNRAEAAARVKRMPMTITSPSRIQRGKITPVFARPQCSAYRVEEIEICEHPNRWMIHEIRVGDRSQFMSTPYPIRGEAFRQGGIMGDVRLDVGLTCQDFRIDVEYVGPVAEGEVFEAVIVGTAAE
jgi:hypothetical protein